jgi:small subunit ribosomal protein S15
MTINAEEKQKVISSYKTHEKDSGSPEVQVALLSTRISGLTDHLKKHVKDFHTRRGLLMLVGRRRRLLDYLKSRSPDRYNKLINGLGLRK